MMSPLILVALGGCTANAPDGADEAPDSGSNQDTVAWSGGLVPALDELAAVRDLQPRRAIIHLHSPWSHDACDGDPLPGGVPDPDCLADLREALCRTAIDFAFVTDHPAHAAEQEFEALFHPQEEDSWWGGADHGEQPALGIDCDGGHQVTWMAGIEDELMPVALDRHVADSPEENDEIYNQSDVHAVSALAEAGGTVLVAHTEGRTLSEIQALHAAGLQGVEIFNLHASFDPGIRQEDLGLDGVSWIADIAPFVDPDGTAEPDLFFLAVLAEQYPSIAIWDGLLADGPTVGVAGTDAHQNVYPMELRDGERGDSYRRMLRWFSNHLYLDIDDGSAASAEAALAAGRNVVVFEALGTPNTIDFHIQDEDGTTWEMGSSEANAGDLYLGCPTLAPSSPRGTAEPELAITIFKDGEPWAAECGTHRVTEAGSYRARINMIPWHLEAFLGEDGSEWMRAFPWVYTNSIQVQ